MPLQCTLCGGTGYGPCPEIEIGCYVCDGVGYLEFDKLIPERTVNSVLVFLRSIGPPQSDYSVEPAHVVVAAEQIGIPNAEVLQQYLKDHWNQEVDPKAYNAWVLHLESYWWDP